VGRKRTKSQNGRWTNPKDENITGLWGEKLFAYTFDMRLDLSIYEGGDDGIDFRCAFEYEGFYRPDMAIDVKAFTYEGPNANLLVKEGECNPAYVYVMYTLFEKFRHAPNHFACCRGWELGANIIKVPAFDHDPRTGAKYKTRNHTILADHLKPPHLLWRIIGPPTPGTISDPNTPWKIDWWSDEPA
jgi:hypothetical protein